jgi:hypothetical protein
VTFARKQRYYPLDVSAVEKMGFEPTTSWLPVINILSIPFCEDTENIGILELHVIPNVCSEYSEHNFSQKLDWNYLIACFDWMINSVIRVGLCHKKTGSKIGPGFL